MPTISDVAKAAGVSITTVSRVMNGGRDFNPATIRKVEATVKRLGYATRAVRPGPKPRQRRGIKIGTIVFMSTHSTPPEKMYQMPALPLLLGGIQGALKRHGLELVLAHCMGEQALPAALAGNRADGVLLFGYEPLQTSLKKALEKIPAVWCFRSDADTERRFDHVFYDNSYVGRLAAEYLLERKHRKLAVFNPMPVHGAAIARQEQFMQVAREHGAEVASIRPKDDRPLQNSLSVIDDMVTGLRSLELPPTGVFCPTDDILVKLYYALRKLGVDPGAEYEMIGCNNDLAYMNQMHPRPATIDIRLATVGARAVEQLLWRMAHPDDTDRVEIFVSPVLVPGGEEGADSTSNFQELEKASK